MAREYVKISRSYGKVPWASRIGGAMSGLGQAMTGFGSFWQQKMLSDAISKLLAEDQSALQSGKDIAAISVAQNISPLSVARQMAETQQTPAVLDPQYDLPMSYASDEAFYPPDKTEMTPEAFGGMISQPEQRMTPVESEQPLPMTPQTPMASALGMPSEPLRPPGGSGARHPFDQMALLQGFKQVIDQGVPSGEVQKALMQFQAIAQLAAKHGRPEIAVDFAKAKLSLMERLYGVEGSLLRSILSQQAMEGRLGRRLEQERLLAELGRRSRERIAATPKQKLEKTPEEDLASKHRLLMNEINQKRQELRDTPGYGIGKERRIKLQSDLDLLERQLEAIKEELGLTLDTEPTDVVESLVNKYIGK